MFIFFLIILFPLIEITGFNLVSDRIGTGLSLLWIVADVFIGFKLLTYGRTKLMYRSNSSVEELFNDLCVIAAALLLIFPGFMSDLLALPLLIPPVRHWIFLFLKRKYGSILDDVAMQQSTYWDPESKSGMKTIEGDFRKIDEDHSS